MNCIRFTNRSSVVPHLGQTTPGEAPDTPGSQVDLRGPRGLNSSRVLLVVPGLGAKAVAAIAAHGAKVVPEDPALGATTKTNNSNLANSSRIRASTNHGKYEHHFDIFVIFPIKSGYWVNLSQINLIKTQKIIAYLVANFMRISKMVLKILL